MNFRSDIGLLLLSCVQLNDVFSLRDVTKFRYDNLRVAHIVPHINDYLNDHCYSYNTYRLLEIQRPRVFLTNSITFKTYYDANVFKLN